ncbi:MAG: TRAP transporter substrate-binding protein [Pseudomonadota bacterium]
MISIRSKTTLIAAIVAAALAAPGAANAQEKIRNAGNFATEHSSSVAMEVFRSEVARLTNHQLSVDNFPAMQLGGAKENVDGVRAGTIFMTWVGAAFLSRLVPELEAVSLPFLFPDREAALRVIDGPVGDLLDHQLRAKGFVSLGWMELGQRHVTNSKRPIASLADLKGLKIRLQPNETHLATFRALGANAVAMDVKELYSALQQGVMDGQENPFAIIEANRYFEVQKYVSNTGHFFDFISVVANHRQFEAMKPETRTAVRTAMASAIAHQRKLAAEADKAALATLRSKGMQYNEISPALRAELREATKGVIDEVRKRAGADLVDRVLAETRKSS